MSATNNQDKFAPRAPPKLFVPRKKEPASTFSLSDQLKQKQAAKSSPQSSSQPFQFAAADSKIDGSGSKSAGGAANTFQFQGPSHLPTFPTSASKVFPDLDHQQQLKDLHMEINEGLAERKQLKRDNAIQQRKVAELTEALRIETDKKEVAVATQKTLLETLTEANDELEKVNEGADKASEDAAKYKREGSSYKALNKSLAGSVEDKKATIKALEGELAASRALNTAQRERIELLTREGQEIMNDRDGKNSELASLRAEIQVAEPEVLRLRKVATQVSEAEMAYGTLVSQLKNTELEFARVVGAKDLELEQVKLELQQATVALSAPTTVDDSPVVEDLRAQISQLEGLNANRAAASQREIANLSASLAAHQSQLSSLNDSYSAMVDDKDLALKEAKEQADGTIATLGARLSIAEEDALTRDAEIDSLGKRLRTVQDSSLEIAAELRALISRLREEASSSDEAARGADIKAAMTVQKLAEKEEELAAEQAAHEDTKGALSKLKADVSFRARLMKQAAAAAAAAVPAVNREPEVMEQRPSAVAPREEVRAVRYPLRLLQRDQFDDVFEEYSRREFRRSAMVLSVSSIDVQETEPVSPEPLAIPAASFNVSAGTQTTVVPASVVEVENYLAITQGTNEEVPVAVVSTPTRSSRFSWLSWSNMILFGLVACILAGFFSNPVIPSVSPIAGLIDAPSGRGFSAASVYTTDTPAPTILSYVEAYTYTTASSVEVPTSTSVAAVPRRDYLPQVFYSFRMPGFGHSFVFHAVEYWKRFESTVRHRLAGLFARSG
ncbi:hypothetical protein DSL72_004219 [Monilinia vaccinii-corymbosi]|uniref:Uncharacterized protein n=1 Tax=Monilinia vaccinii-corymbosi TaxID=61207 RepID=A0A8A3NYQ5_9HELO|nr:hypothetical protein DSL72_004219 [Monilinia vaccinii-corymbosi]